MMNQLHKTGQLCFEKLGSFMTLTHRELEVLQLIVAELTTDQIANRLGIRVSTVETHRRNLLRKAGVRSVVGLVKEHFSNVAFVQFLPLSLA